MNISLLKHIETIELKLNRANGFLAKIRYHVDLETLKSITLLPSSNLNFNMAANYVGRSEPK